MTNKAIFIKAITKYIQSNPGCILNSYIPIGDQTDPEFVDQVELLRLVELFAINPAVWDICAAFEDNGINDGGTYDEETWDGKTTRCRLFEVTDFDFLTQTEIYELRCDVYTDVNDNILRFEIIPD
jgi:hypothetical protein